jgi:hypothetical protein
MKIVILAWGSLIWNPGNLAVSSDFRLDGPRLPIEFSRISGDGRLTLVIDETSGALCPTYTAVSGFRELGAAVENLRTREGMPSTKGVGFINPESGSQSNTSLQRHPTAVEQIRAWSNTHGRPAVIWTALASNFHEPAKANKHFSVEAAIRYLETCDPKTLASALAYIHQTPPEIQTPLRTAIGERWPRKE